MGQYDKLELQIGRVTAKATGLGRGRPRHLVCGPSAGAGGIMESTVRLRRAQRSAKSLKGGEEILRFLLTPNTRKKLVKAAEAGVAPVSVISLSLAKLGSEKNIDLGAWAVRQFIGTAVRAVLESQGYTVVEKGVRLPKDPIFSTGSVYGRRQSATTDAHDLLEKVISSLSQTEAVRAFNLLKVRLGKADPV